MPTATFEYTGDHIRNAPAPILYGGQPFIQWDGKAPKRMLLPAMQDGTQLIVEPDNHAVPIGVIDARHGRQGGQRQPNDTHDREAWKTEPITFPPHLQGKPEHAALGVEKHADGLHHKITVTDRSLIRRMKAETNIWRLVRETT